jgi:succinate dehydrogenase / fumarate reductase cytochrome b subunit
VNFHVVDVEPSSAPPAAPSSSAQSRNHLPKSPREATPRAQSCGADIAAMRAGRAKTSGTILAMRGPSSLTRFQRYFSSSVGTKLLIGITGLLLFVYMVLHLAGNALVFGGPGLFNEYSHKLISNPLLIPIEIGLLAVFLLHVYKTIRMVMANQAARPVGYEKKTKAGHTSRKSFASSTMIGSGLVLFLFILVHVKQFKYGAYYQTVSDNPIRDLYRTELEVFRNPFWVLFYVIGTLVVGLHLRHGISSGFQSIGLDHPLYTRRLTIIGIVLAAIIGGGLALIPIWVYLTH